MRDFSLKTLKAELQRHIEQLSTLSGRMERALSLAFNAHANQTREQRSADLPSIPYITHPVGVAVLVAELWRDQELDDTFEDAICAALTHDVLEDTDVDFDHLEQQTSQRCAELVLALTKPVSSRRETRQQRNIRFTAQIRAGGSTVRYIKLCDAAHNLDRPAAMPATLLRKTVDKVSRFYLPLAAGEPYEGRLRRELDRRVKIAKAADHYKDTRTQKLNTTDIDSFLSTCGKLTQSKVFEEHDIEAWIAKIEGVSSVVICSPEDFLDTQLLPIGTGVTEDYAGIIRKSPASGSAISLKNGVSGSSNETDSVADTLLMAPLYVNVGASNSGFVHCFVQRKLAPTWFTENALTAAVGILAARLRVRVAREIADMAITLAHYELTLSPGTAIEHGLDHRDIVRIKNQSIKAAYVQTAVQQFLTDLLSRNFLDEHQAVLTGRLKSPESILRKMRAAGTKKQRNPDDLVGLRIVVITTTSRDSLSDQIHNALEISATEQTLPFRIDLESLREDKISSSAGYSSTHIRFYVGQENDEANVGVEIQLRTVFEDAWARVSQFASYHSQRNISAKQSKRLLRQLADNKDTMEQIVLQLS